MVTQTWIIEFLKMYKISDEVIKFIKEAIKKLENGLNIRRKMFSNCKNP